MRCGAVLYAAQFTLIWRYCSTDIFILDGECWLPHGYDGVNAMLNPRGPTRTRRFT